ncbi:MAG: hypothetical protein U0929_09300 [Planctomycetaceae bacterium]
MSISISIRVPAGELAAIRDRVQQRITGARSQLVQSAISAALTDVIESIPVQTGEARAGWQGELNRVANSPAASSSEHISQQSATNTVDHIVYLEYGTSRMQPRSTVRPALVRLESTARSMFRWGN